MLRRTSAMEAEFLLSGTWQRELGDKFFNG
jgi:hypothetical protein